MCSISYKSSFCVILLPCCNTCWYTVCYGWQQRWQQRLLSVFFLDISPFYAVFEVYNLHFLIIFDYEKWEVPLFHCIFLICECLLGYSNVRNGMLVFRVWNASIPRLDCLHFISDLLAFTAGLIFQITVLSNWNFIF